MKYDFIQIYSVTMFNVQHIHIDVGVFEPTPAGSFICAAHTHVVCSILCVCVCVCVCVWCWLVGHCMCVFSVCRLFFVGLFDAEMIAVIVIRSTVVSVYISFFLLYALLLSSMLFSQ
jgi:hypothetical protein